LAAYDDDATTLKIWQPNITSKEDQEDMSHMQQLVHLRTHVYNSPSNTNNVKKLEDI
jgi:hypothetical protein